MQRIILGIIIYIVVQLVLLIAFKNSAGGELLPMLLHAVALILAVLIPSIVVKKGIKVGKVSIGIALLVLVSFSIFKFFQVSIFILPEKKGLSGVNYFYTFCILALISIAEELYFRGVVQEDLSAKYNVYVGGIVSVAFFTFIHLDTSIIGLTFQVLTGAIFVLLYNRFKGVLLPSLAHVIGNSTVFLYINGI